MSIEDGKMILEIKKPGVKKEPYQLPQFRMDEITRLIGGGVISLDQDNYTERELPFLIQNLGGNLKEKYPHVFLGEAEAEAYAAGVIAGLKQAKNNLN